MRGRRRHEWEDNEQVYSSGQVESVLEFAGVDIDGDTHTHFLCYCPFHGNTDSPAMAVDKSNGLFTCFNPACMTSGTLEELLRLRKGLNPFQATRVILKYENAHDTPFASRMQDALNKAPEFVEFSQEALDKMHADFSGSVAEKYMHDRHFTDETLDYFRVGYSVRKNMVTVPMHDPKGMPVGLIGRTPSHTDKAFKNSVGLPKSLTAWNFHRARETGDTVIILEASYDAMRVHQAGYHNVIALLGGHVTAHHIEQISRTFSKVIIMTDFDKKQYYPNCRKCNYKPCNGHRPGRDLGRAIVDKLPNKKVMWAAFSDECVFPNWPLSGYRSQAAKDASDMSDAEIRQCLRNAVSNLQYVQWDMEERTENLVASLV